MSNEFTLKEIRAELKKSNAELEKSNELKELELKMSLINRYQDDPAYHEWVDKVFTVKKMDKFIYKTTKEILDMAE